MRLTCGIYVVWHHFVPKPFTLFSQVLWSMLWPHHQMWLAWQCDQSLLTLISQIRYSLVVILELNGGSEVQYKDMMIVDDGKYQ